MYISPFMRHSLVCSVLVLSLVLIIPSIAVADSKHTTLKNLSSFLHQLERNHPQLKAAKAEQEAASARTRAASRPLYNPELEFDNERVGFNSRHVDTTMLGIKQSIDWHDKRAARKNIATVSQQLTRYEQERIHQQLIADIFIALADYQVQREVIQSYKQRFGLTKQVLAQAMRLYKAGDISKLDLEQIRLSQTRSQLALNQAKTILVGKAQALSAIAGETRKTWPTLPYAPPYLNTAKLRYDHIRNNSPSLKVQTMRVAQARSIMRLRVREQKADPTIGLRAGGEDSDKVIGLTLSIPLNIRNNYRAEVDEAKADIRRAESQLENSKHQLKTRLQSSAESYQLTYSGWKSWQKIAGNSLKNQSHLLMRLWKAGELSTSDYLVQLNQIKEAELNHVELKGNVWKAWFNWLAVSNQFKQWLNGQMK